MAADTTDFLVVGGGIIGLSIARELRRRHPDQRVTLLEKEPSWGAHASGRNSGVLHAGFYYSADSLKARFTRAGNQRLSAYCEERKLRLLRCGKLVVARGPEELAGLDELHRRGQANGVPLQMLSEAEARSLEPRVKTHERALFSPTTSTVDPHEVMDSLARDAAAEGVALRTAEAFAGRDGQQVRTSRGRIAAGYVVNAAGLYADRVARAYGFAQHYRILPFKGLYLYSDEPPGALRVHVYPVPNLRQPFLGVHFTVQVDGRAKIGPTALPAFWREQYGGLSGFRPGELLDIAARGAALFLGAGFDFRRLAFEELSKRSRGKLVRLAGELLEGVREEHYRTWGKPGIRAQLLDTRTRALEMDFVFEGDDRSMHVLNAVSPGFTCSMPFAEYVCDAIERGGVGTRVPAAFISA
ncbi:MAG: L-2-hydroxyglutarate oxidase [Myxococcaceae bacterium]